MLKEMEDIVTIVKHNLKQTRDRQKSYAGLKRTPMEFQVGVHVYLKVRPKRSSLKLGKCVKLALGFVDLFKY